ncbi:hypothetical protein B0H13DRAFT_2023814 [Mycena leptocephala]|nr:hypothetical protein B0H13DRAFT_2023814 [Mycena leptocephala]
MSVTPLAIKLLLGPIFIGTIISTYLFGVCSSQFTIYYGSKRRLEDSTSLRALVVYEFIISTVSTATSIYYVWLYLVDNYFNPAFLQGAPWPLSAIPLLTALSACPVQIFMAYRVLSLSSSRGLFALLVFLTLVHGAIAAATSLLAFRLTFEEGARLIPVVDSWIAVTVANDFSLTVFLIYYLNQNRTGHIKSDTVVGRLIRSTLESAAFATFFSIMVLITFTKLSTTGFHLMFSQPMGRIYTSTLLSTLNGRESLRQDLQGTYGFTDSLNFRPSGDRSTVAVRITMDEDSETDKTSRFAIKPTGSVVELGYTSRDHEGASPPDLSNTHMRT